MEYSKLAQTTYTLATSHFFIKLILQRLMEILRPNLDTRSNESPFVAQNFTNNKLIGLSILEDKPSVKARVVFNTENLIKNMTQTKSASDEPLLNPCLLTHKYKPPHFLRGRKQNSQDTNIVVGRYSQLDDLNHLDTTCLNLLPITKCRSHGMVGFLPLDDISELPEYTCITHIYPIFKVVHSFEDCILEFPRTQPIGIS
ncbi:hypothetical protein CASFOL_024844 [Castilleja foliolosa]|uniref:Uncharacterized protein n=1 Tax=Castilleja foliolosa TaxID=1961234 RepID=A0ABD3CPI2_9LAMI